MNQIKIGQFISQKRKEKGYTQQQLGDLLGVTGKTISRWETGNYLPPAECLILLSGIYGVSINEILAGERVAREEFVEIAEKNITSTLKELEKDYQKFEKRMIGILILTAILTITIIWLLPMQSVKDVVVLILVVVVAFIANTLNIIALATKKAQC